MLFRNLTLYRLPATFACSMARLSDAVSTLPARECGPLEAETMGFVAPELGCGSGGHWELVLASGPSAMLRIRTERKSIPPGAVETAVQRRALPMERGRGTPLSRRELIVLKQEETERVLRGLPSAVSDLRVWLDLKRGWVGCDTTNRSRADSAVSLLRTALDTFPARPLEPSIPPTRRLTDWLVAQHPPHPFGFGEDCDLSTNGRRSAAWKGRGVDLTGEQVRKHLELGMQARRLGLTFDKTLAFALDHSLTIHGIKRIADSKSSEDADLTNQFRASVDALSPLVTSIIDTFGVFQYANAA